MNGSEKQIKWAEQIKAQFMVEAAQIKNETDRATVTAFLNAVDDATLFIDNRRGLDSFWLFTHRGADVPNKKSNVAQFAARLKGSNYGLYKAARNLYSDDFRFDIRER